MSSAREEILRLSIDKLRNRTESIMFNINIILSHPDKSNNHVDNITDLLIELSTTEGAMKHAQNLMNQCLELRLQELESQMKEIKQPEE